MTRILTLAALLLACSSAHACETGPWHSTDKTLHAIGNAVVVMGTDLAVRDWAPETFQRYPYLGLIPALAVSAGREVWKTKHHGQCEWASMAYDAAGMAVGVAGTRWLLVPQDKGVLVAYVKEF